MRDADNVGGISPIDILAFLFFDLLGYNSASCYPLMLHLNIALCTLRARFLKYNFAFGGFTFLFVIMDKYVKGLE